MRRNYSDLFEHADFSDTDISGYEKRHYRRSHLGGQHLFDDGAALNEYIAQSGNYWLI